MRAPTNRPRLLSVSGTIAACAIALAIGVGCDREEQHRAAEKTGDGVEKAVNVVGDATRDAAHAAGNVLQRTGEKVKDASTPDPATRPTTPAAP